jgi:hypothetical protein
MIFDKKSRLSQFRVEWQASTSAGWPSWNGESGRSRIAPVSGAGRVSSSVAAMIAPLEKPMAEGTLAKP